MRYNRVAIVGSRKFLDYDLLKSKCDQILSNLESIEIVSGGARGADTLAEKYALERGYKFTEFEAKWKDIEGKPEHLIKENKSGKYYVLAGHERNEEMARYCDYVISFNKGTSGSSNMLKMAEKHNCIIREIKV